MINDYSYLPHPEPWQHFTFLSYGQVPALGFENVKRKEKSKKKEVEQRKGGDRRGKQEDSRVWGSSSEQGHSA